MKVAYLILVHAFPGQFIRMVRQLDSNESLFYIHVDKKSNIEPFKEVEKIIAGKKIVWLERKSVVWAGFNAIRVTLNGLKKIVMDGHADHISFISGQHYPIKPVREFHNYLSQNKNKNFFDYDPMPRPNWANGGLDRIHYYHIIFRKFRIAWPLISYLKVKLPYVSESRFGLIRKVINWLPSARKFPRKYLKDCKPYEGSNWFTVSSALATDIVSYVEKDKTVYRYYKYAHISDEMFFQTLILNKLPQWREHLINDNVNFIKFDPTTGRPFDLQLQHLDEIKKSPAFLARKFVPEKSEALLDELDRIICSTAP